jgi:hypothetical protein
MRILQEPTGNGIYAVESRYKATASENCNRMRKMKCGSELVKRSPLFVVTTIQEFNTSSY